MLTNILGDFLSFEHCYGLCCSLQSSCSPYGKSSFKFRELTEFGEVSRGLRAEDELTSVGRMVGFPAETACWQQGTGWPGWSWRQ